MLHVSESAEIRQLSEGQQCKSYARVVTTRKSLAGRPQSDTGLATNLHKTALSEQLRRLLRS